MSEKTSNKMYNFLTYTSENPSSDNCPVYCPEYRLGILHDISHVITVLPPHFNN